MTTAPPDLGVEAFNADPYPGYAYLRQHEPVRWMPWAHAYFVTRWADVQAMADDPVTFSAAVHDSPLSTAIGPNLLHSEGEFHRQLRAPLTTMLRPAAVAFTMRSVIESHVDELLDGLEVGAPQDTVDLIAAYAQPLAIRVISALIGLPALTEATFVRWLEGIAAGASNYERDPAKTAAAAAVNVEIDQVLAQVLGTGPEPGSLIDVLAATPVDERPIRLSELAATVKLLIIGGMQEPRDLFGYAVTATVQQPMIRQRLSSEPAVIGAVIEEALRWGSPVGTVTRRTTRSVTLSGVELPAGSVLAGVLSSANRDDRRWDRPDDFDIDRGDFRHLAFNAGPHACVGASLARMEASIALSRLLERFPELCAAGPSEVSGWEFRGPTTLPVQLGPRARREAQVCKAAGRSASPDRLSDNGFRDARVTKFERVAGDVVLVRVADPQGHSLPSAAAGAHIDVVIPGQPEGVEQVRQYSLTGPRVRDDYWEFAVRRQDDGRGGSMALHAHLGVGQILRIGMPRNHFRFVEAPGYLFLAGGIGITPILPMLSLAQAAGVPWRLHYIGRDLATMPFLDTLPEDHTQVLATAESGRPDLDALVVGLAPGTRVYCCGPVSMMDAVEAAHAAGLAPWCRLDLSVERFAPRVRSQSDVADRAFELELARSARVVPVPADVTALEALAAADVLVPSTCREGTCGSCETRVLAGAVDHRDSVLTPAERSTNDVMMVCVSRAAGERLSVDL